MEKKEVHKEHTEIEKERRGIDQEARMDINDVKEFIMTKATTENLNSISSYVNARYEDLKKKDKAKGSGLMSNKV